MPSLKIFEVEKNCLIVPPPSKIFPSSIRFIEKVYELAVLGLGNDRISYTETGTAWFESEDFDELIDAGEFEFPHEIIGRKLKLVEIEDALMASEVTELLMGSDVAPRKEFIYKHAKEAEIDA